MPALRRHLAPDCTGAGFGPNAGPKLVAELALNSARVVLISGFTDRHIDDAGLGNFALLEKPFTVRELLGTLNEVLVHSV